jgi:hypothetical protein
LSKPFFNVLGLHPQVEALREVVSQVGAQKVLHEQQAEMWKQKYSAMEKLVDHLELLVSVQQQQLFNLPPSSPKVRPKILLFISYYLSITEYIFVFFCLCIELHSYHVQYGHQHGDALEYNILSVEKL